MYSIYIQYIICGHIYILYMSSYSSYFSQGEAIENMSSSSSSLPSTPPPFGALLSSNGTQLSFFYVEAIDTCELKNRGKDWRGNGNSILDKITKRETNKERERKYNILNDNSTHLLVGVLL